MTLALSRVDYVSVGVTSRGTTRILPPTDPKQTQKFAVGDHDGILQVFGMKKGELQALFKSLPGPKINKMILGGSLGMARDKIFIAYGNSVKGFTKKGKLFLEFDTSLLDPISALYVLGPNLAACARDLYHRYHDCKDADSYLAGEILHDVVLLPSDNSMVYAILACGDCAVRVLHGTMRPTVLRLPSIPTVLAVYREKETESTERVLLGTIDGRVGLLNLQGNKTLRITWLINSMGSEITTLDTFELQDGLDIIIGRQDGIVEVFTFPDEDTSPCLRYRYNAGESISTVTGGIIGATNYPEVLVTTYSGKIFGLTTKPPGLLEAGQSDTVVAKLKLEIQQLEEKLIEERETANFTADPLAPLILAVKHRMALYEEDASYSLSVELDTSIDNILIQSDTPIVLLDVENNSAVVSLSVCNPKEGNFVLATYRCQINTNRLEMRLRTIEGQPGTLQIYVTSQVQPKCCRRISIPIYALSLHKRQHIEDDADILSGGPFNELRLNGGFTVAEMHAWLSLVLPDVPERPHLYENEAILTYKSSFIGTILKCRYKKGNAIFLGENISSIIILRDILTREATKRKIKLEVFCDVSVGSISRVLELIRPQLDAVYELIEKIKILDALEEFELKANPKENLCSQYQDLIANEQNIRTKLTKDPDILNRLHGVITDLYVDWERARGARRISSKTAAEKLNDSLESRDFVQLLQIFTGNVVST
ncbi:Bardet-Biedl syndrome 7 protein homolog isoform X1 [Vespa velutina]|uniref:Bardet-Biedl syndrome 7 protein homolog isoform X1 n=2 Tax=Vespa velutina TaxID=202808 RepID=UPI001FB42761|nr:Bardet-Biedl syndrome 7 protein homolog isoform X1 [Vespa velutina]XP_047367654.1 Bardet-Biedl syndrome 7 protein homolog isoform X1 [Vespa velutina]XP_047367655.1 Bardet-Biedl syndrome 7 protein homolog isoform X1 [Vespa velutina]